MLEAASTAAPALAFLNRLKPPRWLFRTVACLVLGGQVISRICKGAWAWRGKGGGLCLGGDLAMEGARACALVHEHRC
jgi:hypothetical protein